MNDATVREHAEAHGRAVVEGDLRRAASDLTEGAQAGAGAVMAQLPRPLKDAEVVDVEQAGTEALARIRYSGEDGAVTVASRWADHGGRPMIVGLEVVETS